VLSTSDAGTRWNYGTLPSGFGFDSLSALSCGDATHCMALGSISVPNTDECGKVPPSDPEGCMTGATEWVTGVVTTDDGGATWALRPLPSSVPDPQMSDLSCSSAQQCWVGGSEAVPQQIGNVYDGGSSVLLGTTDGGASWSRSTFAIPAGAPNDAGGDAYLAVGEISCPRADTCVALGASDQGSLSTAVYSITDN
jgi:hypothetical protein